MDTFEIVCCIAAFFAAIYLVIDAMIDREQP
jgi:hypothetical protein